MSDPYADGGRLNWITLARKRRVGRPRKNEPPPPQPTELLKRPGYFWAKNGRYFSMVFVDHAGEIWRVRMWDKMTDKFKQLLPIPVPTKRGER